MLSTRSLFLFLTAACLLTADTQHEVIRDGPRGAKFQPAYEMDITGKTPAYLDHLFLIFRAFTASGFAAAKTATNMYWGAQQIKVDHVPSDITLTPNLYRRDDTGALAGDPTALD